MWDLRFITRDQFKEHVAKTIDVYVKSARNYGLDEFNRNIIDPIKLTFDSKVYNRPLEQVINDEIGRQRDKTNNNAIGYFHQNIFLY